MWAILIVSGLSFIALTAGQPLSEGNEAEFGSNMVLGGALSELVEHDTASQAELGRQRNRVSRLSGETEQLRSRLRGAEKSETSLKRLVELSDAAQDATRSRCNRRLVELQRSCANKTHSIRKHLSDCVSQSARLKQTRLQADDEYQRLKSELEKERLRATNAERRSTALEKELHQTTQALQLAQSLSHELKSAATRAEHTQDVLSKQLDAEHTAETGLEKVLVGLRTQLANKSSDLSHKENAWSAAQKQLRAAFEAEHATRMSKEHGLSQLTHGLADALRSLSRTQKERDNAVVVESNCQHEMTQAKRELNMTLTSLLASRSNATSTLTELQRTRHELDRTRSGLVIANETVVTLRGQMQQLAEGRNAAEAELSRDRPKLASTKHGLSIAKEKVEELGKTCNQLKQQMSTLSSDSAKLLSTEHAKMESTLSQLGLMRSQLTQTKQDLNASLTEAAVLNSSRSGFISEQAAMAQKVASALAAEHMQLGAMTLMLSRAHADLVSKDEELGSVRTRFAAANTQVEQLDTMRHKMAAQLRDLQEDGNATVHELLFRLEDSARALAQTQSEWQEKDRELASLRRALQVAATAFASLQGMHEELRGQVGNVSKELQGTRSELHTDTQTLGRVGKALVGATSQEAFELNANRDRLDAVIDKLEKTQVREQGALHNKGEGHFKVPASKARAGAQTFDAGRDHSFSHASGGAEHAHVLQQAMELERLHKELAAKINELNVTRGKLFHERKEQRLQSAKANERVRFADTAKDQLLKSAQEALHIALTKLSKTRSALQNKESELEQTRAERMSHDRELASAEAELHVQAQKLKHAQLAEAELHVQAQKLKLAQLALDVDDHAMRDASAERHSLLEELNATRAASGVKDDLLKSAEVALHLALADLNKTRLALRVSENAQAYPASQRVGAPHAATSAHGKSAGAAKVPGLMADSVQMPLALSVADSNHVRSSPSAGDVGGDRTALRTALADLEMTRRILGARSTDPNATTVAFRAREELLHDAQEVSHLSAQFNKTRLDLQVAEQELGRVHMDADTHERELQVAQARLLSQDSALQAAHQALASTDHALSVAMSKHRATLNELNDRSASFKMNTRKLQETEATLRTTLEDLKRTRGILGIQDDELKEAAATREAEERDLATVKRTLFSKSEELQAAQRALTASVQEQSIRSLGGSKDSNTGSSKGSSKGSSSKGAAESQGALHKAAAEVDQAQQMLRIRLQELAKLHADVTARDVKLNATSTELERAHSKLMMRDAQVAAYEQTLQKLLANQGKQSKDSEVHESSALHSKNAELMAAHVALSMTEAKLNRTSVALGLSEHERERLEVLEHNLSTTLDNQGKVLHTVASNFSRVLTEFSALKREEARLQADDHSLTARLGDRVRELNVMHSALKDVSVSLAKSEAKDQQLNRTLVTNGMLYGKVQMGLAAAEKRTRQLLQEMKMLRKRDSQLESTNANLSSERNNRSNELLAALAHVHKLRKVNKHLKQTTRKLRLAVATMGKEVVETRSAAEKALAESQQNKHELDSTHAALTETKQHLTAVEMKDARLRKALRVKVKSLHSQLSQAATNTTAVSVENDKLMKELHAEQQELNATRVMLKAAQTLAKDLARNIPSLGTQTRNQSALGLVASKQAKKLAHLKELKKEVVKIHTLLDHDEKLLRRYRQSQKRLRARLKQLPHQNGTTHALTEEQTAQLRQLALVRDDRKRLKDQNRALLAVVKQLRAKLGQDSDSGMAEEAEMEGQG